MDVGPDGEVSRLTTESVLRSLADACDPDLPAPDRIDIGVSGLYDVTCRIWLPGEAEYVPNSIHIDP